MSESPTSAAPAYVYSAGTILDYYPRLDAALAPLDHLICYAVKANSNRAILKVLANEGAGFDIVSGGELYRVLAAGGDPRSVLSQAWENRPKKSITRQGRRLQFQCRERSGVGHIDRDRGRKEIRAPTALRANPDVDPRTHEYISTGSHENKFGIALDRSATVYARAAKMRNIKIIGVQMHIGSQITEAKPFASAIERSRRSCAN